MRTRSDRSTVRTCDFLFSDAAASAVAFAAASLHEVEHLYLFWIYRAHSAFYAAGGFEGIMGYDGVISSPLARPYLHFAYNFLVIVPMALAFWDETKRVRCAWPQPAPPEPPLAVSVQQGVVAAVLSARARCSAAGTRARCVGRRHHRHSRHEG